VQGVLTGKINTRSKRHNYEFRRMLTCNCKYSLIGERQKGTVYYRCHNKQCPQMATPTKLEKFLELAGNAGLSHAIAFPEERRDMVKIFTSNRLANGKKVDFKPSLPFQEIVNRPNYDYCDQRQDIPRTWDKILDTLAALNSQDLLPDLSLIADVGKRKGATDPMKDGRDDSSAEVK
jgi:hypothetical protein